MKIKYLFIIMAIIIIVFLIIIFNPRNDSYKNETIYTTINSYDERLNSDNNIFIGQEVPNGIKQYETKEELREDFPDSSFYLKHVIENGKVKESYIEFIITKDMIDSNSGVYKLKGYEKDFENNKRILLKSFGESNCEDNNSYIHCKVNTLYANVFKNGYVEVGEDFWNCYITDKGVSRCIYGK